MVLPVLTQTLRTHPRTHTAPSHQHQTTLDHMRKPIIKPAHGIATDTTAIVDRLDAPRPDPPTPTEPTGNTYRQTKLHTPTTWDIDTVPVGIPPLIKPKDCDRFRFHNPNGISHYNDMNDATHIIDCASADDVTFLLLAETKLDTSDPKVAAKLRQKTKKIWPVSTSITSSSEEAFPSAYKPGGTALFVQGGWTGHMTKNFSDPWTGGYRTVLQGRHGTSLAIISAYRVSQTHTCSHRVSTAYMQQWRHLKNRGYTTPKPRQQCLTDLTTHIQTFKARQIPVILCWDATKPTHSRALQEFMLTNDLVDILEHRYGQSQMPPTHRDGQHKIDHIMLSPELLTYVQDVWIEALGMGYPSDHRSLGFDFQLARLLRGNASHIESPRHRAIHTRDPSLVQAYTDFVWEYLEQHSFAPRIQRLKQMTLGDPDMPQLLEQLDGDMSQARLSAAKKVGKTFQTPWSPKLRQAKLLIAYWKTRLASFKNRRNDSRMHSYITKLS